MDDFFSRMKNNAIELDRGTAVKRGFGDFKSKMRKGFLNDFHRRLGVSVGPN
jgi:hypothetical protein